MNILSLFLTLITVAPSVFYNSKIHAGDETICEHVNTNTGFSGQVIIRRYLDGEDNLIKETWCKTCNRNTELHPHDDDTTRELSHYEEHE